MGQDFDPDATAADPPELAGNANASGSARRRTYLRLVYAQTLPRASDRLGERAFLDDGPSGLVLGRKPSQTDAATVWALASDRWLSRHHLRVSIAPGSDGGRVRLEDLGSRHGTYLNGERLAAPATATPGDVVRAGSSVFVVGRAALALEDAVAADPALAPPAGVDVATPAMLAIWERLARHAATPDPVLLLGESGTGKTQLGKALHARSARATQPFLVANCGAFHHEIQAELFGVVEGVFPGVRGRAGFFEAVKAGTLFLDEVADLPAKAQAALLQAVDTTNPSFYRVGSRQPQPVRCRLITATHHDIETRVRDGRFRHDLLARLATVQVTVPPVRERRDDILAMYAAFLGDAAGGPDAPVVPLAVAAEALLLAPWHENVRGLDRLAAAARAGDPIDVAAVRAFGTRGAAAAHPPTHAAGPGRADRPAPPSTPATSRSGAVRFRCEWAGRPWPLEAAELLTLLHDHQWNAAEAARAVHTRREAISNRIRDIYGAACGAPASAATADTFRVPRDAAKAAWRVWQASGRLPSPADVARLAALYAAGRDDDESRARRQEWERTARLP